MKVLNIKQGHLTSECWQVQFFGLAACKKCIYKGTKACGGLGVILSGKNKKGHEVPLGEDHVS